MRNPPTSRRREVDEEEVTAWPTTRMAEGVDDPWVYSMGLDDEEELPCLDDE
jgi:hypothetical protein